MAGFDEFSFQPPRATAAEPDDDDAPRAAGKLVADKLALTTDKAGAATVALRTCPRSNAPASCSPR